MKTVTTRSNVWLLAAVLGALVAPSCGGSVEDGPKDGGGSGNGGDGGTSGSGGGGGEPTGCTRANGTVAGDGDTSACRCADTGRMGTQTCRVAQWTDCRCDDTPPGQCGNGLVEEGELCDGTNLDGESCGTATMQARPSGTLRCSSFCTFDTSGCFLGGGTGGSGGMAGFGGVAGINP